MFYDSTMYSKDFTFIVYTFIESLTSQAGKKDRPTRLQIMKLYYMATIVRAL